jgi:hypothetical protein
MLLSPPWFPKSLERVQATNVIRRRYVCVEIDRPHSRKRARTTRETPACIIQLRRRLSLENALYHTRADAELPADLTIPSRRPSIPVFVLQQQARRDAARVSFLSTWRARDQH